jgi:hypothetical protein
MASPTLRDVGVESENSENLVRAPKGNLCRLSAFSMHRDHDLTLAPLLMLVSVKAAAALSQPQTPE